MLFLSSTSDVFRLAVTIMIVIVIMRPSCGLTKNRVKERTIGAVIGGVIAAAIVFSLHNPYLYGAIGVVSMVIALSMMQKTLELRLLLLL